MSETNLVLLVATKKGLFIGEADARRQDWTFAAPHFLGHMIHHAVLDPRDGRTLVVAAKTGHLGPTIFRSTDFGASWAEAKTPPAFPKAPEGQPARAVDHTFWLTPGHVSEPGVWYAGTSPQGLFRSDDGAETWSPVAGLNDDAQYRAWMGGEQDGTPDGPKLHSVIVDVRDPSRLFLAMSSGGVHESTDAGASWRPMIEGLEVVQGFDPSDITLHDPHCVRQCPTKPDRLYQQNHCGVFRLDLPEKRWLRIGKALPADVGDVGFPMVVHPRDPDRAFVFPMDGSDVWPRTSPGGRPAAFATSDGGETWRRLDRGFPQQNAWWTVLRQAMCIDALEPAGLYLGATCGEVWASADEGENWTNIARHLPHIYAVEVAARA